MFELNPLVILGVGIISVVIMIVVLRINAFLALIVSAIAVSLLSPGVAAEKITRVALAFGSTAGGIGIVIAMASIMISYLPTDERRVSVVRQCALPGL